MYCSLHHIWYKMTYVYRSVIFGHFGIPDVKPAMTLTFPTTLAPLLVNRLLEIFAMGRRSTNSSLGWISSEALCTLSFHSFLDIVMGNLNYLFFIVWIHLAPVSVSCTKTLEKYSVNVSDWSSLFVVNTLLLCFISVVVRCWFCT